MQQSIWTEQLDKHRIFFEVINRALLTVTWSSLCFVASFMVIRGYWTPAPALAAMHGGWILYVAFATLFVLVAVATSGILLWSLWWLVRCLKEDIERSSGLFGAFLIGSLSKTWHFVFFAFVFMLMVILAGQVLIALGEIPPRPRPTASSHSWSPAQPSVGHLPEKR